MKISFQFQKAHRLIRRQQLRAFVSELYKKQNIKPKGLTIVFCSDEFLLNINREFLQHDFYTDIITFDLTESSADGNTGEIYISVDRVLENALKLKIDSNKELHRVIFHGILHLCGYKDKTKKDKFMMREMEENYLCLYFDVPRETFTSNF